MPPRGSDVRIPTYAPCVTPWSLVEKGSIFDTRFLKKIRVPVTLPVNSTS